MVFISFLFRSAEQGKLAIHQKNMGIVGHPHGANIQVIQHIY